VQAARLAVAHLAASRTRQAHSAVLRTPDHPKTSCRLRIEVRGWRAQPRSRRPAGPRVRRPLSFVTWNGYGSGPASGAHGAPPSGGCSCEAVGWVLSGPAAGTHDGVPLSRCLAESIKVTTRELTPVNRPIIGNTARQLPKCRGSETRLSRFGHIESATMSRELHPKEEPTSLSSRILTFSSLCRDNPGHWVVRAPPDPGSGCLSAKEMPWTPVAGYAGEAWASGPGRSGSFHAG
jgi:hypothetical protein